MPCYFAPDVTCTGSVRVLPAFARLRGGDKWKTRDSTQNGKRGTIAWMGDSEDCPQPGTTGWEECADGLLYLRGVKMPEQGALVRPHRVDGIDYTTAAGATITIPSAFAAPRKLLFSTAKVGDPASDWAQRAFALFDQLASKEHVSAFSTEVLSLIADAIGHVYYVTPEILDELGWITSADIDPILVCMMGLDPKKAHQPAGATSPSPVGV